VGWREKWKENRDWECEMGVKDFWR
jgi:hypothetical protein